MNKYHGGSKQGRHDTSMTTSTLFVLAHPDLHASRANRYFADRADTIDDVLVHDLYSAYPDMFVNGFAERKLLENTKNLVIQMPLHWYAGPGLLKEWVDTTFTGGWAYGQNGEALKGKNLLLSVTTGSEHAAYGANGTHRFPIEDFLKPYQQTAYFCGMNWCEPLVFHHARVASQESLQAHGDELISRLEALA